MHGTVRNVLLLVHYWLPLALGWSLAMVMHRATGVKFSPAGFCLLLSGIGAAYSFDRLFEADRHPRWLQWTLRSAAAGCSGMVLLAASQTPPRVLAVVGLLSVTSLVYPALKRVPFVKTLAVALSWTWASAALPLAGAHLAWNWWSVDVSLPLVLLIAAGCILCDLKDAEQDRGAHVPSLPVLLGPRVTCLVAAAMALLAAGLAWADGRYGVAVGSVLLALAAQFPSLLAREAVGPMLVDAILVVPGILILIGFV